MDRHVVGETVVALSRVLASVATAQPAPAQKAPPKEEVAAKTDDTKKEVAAAEGVEGYLAEADDRISKLEETLDKLSEKLSELDDE